MATKSKTTNGTTTGVNINEPERFKLGESGYSGLNIFQGVSIDEVKKELNFPASVKTFKQMSYHGTINSALTLYESLIAKADWKIVEPENATTAEKRQSEFIRECMKDMDHTWQDFIKEVLSMNIYGFSVHEKVYRKRYLSNGSDYNDGLIGWKRLPIRSQESVERFLFSDDGNDIVGVRQNISQVADPYNRFNGRASIVNLPASKVLLFRVGRHRGDPYGKSLLRDAYLGWRYLTAIEEIEANGVAKDMVGLPVLSIPAQYLSADATPDQKAIRAYWENALRNLQMNQQSSVMLPSAYDPDTRQPLFKLELLSVASQKSFDTGAVKEYYKNLILTSLFADLLTMGQSTTGSYALGSIKSSLIGVAVENIVKGICEIINNDLIRQTYQLNGWDVSRRCKLDYDNLETPNMEEFSKFVQRVASVGFMTKDLETVNRVRENMGLDPLPEGTDVEALLTDTTTRAGDGMAKGSGNGTSDSVQSTDGSSSNLDNNA